MRHTAINCGIEEHNTHKIYKGVKPALALIRRTEMGIVFQEFDLSRDQVAVTKMLKLTWQKRMPVILKGERFVVGFKSGEIEKVIDL